MRSSSRIPAAVSWVEPNVKRRIIGTCRTTGAGYTACNYGLWSRRAERHMPHCENCGGFVTRNFVRVFGDNHDNVQGCMECCDRTAVREGGVVAEPTT